MMRSYARHAAGCGSRDHARTVLQRTLLAYFENTVSNLSRGILALALTACVAVSSGLARAAEPTPEVFASAKSLDEQVQEVGLRVLTLGNGDHGSLFLTPSLGGAYLFGEVEEDCGSIPDPQTGESVVIKDGCVNDIEYGGPMVGLGVEWRE